jgi:FKBP-type peptidyl-prolyl cis-trans isomerase FklB
LAAGGSLASEVTVGAADADASYRFGLSFGEQLRRLGITNELAPQDIARGVADALAGKATTPEDAARLTALIGELRQRVIARNRAAARSFLESNARERNVRTTESGLQYRVLAPGNARAPAPQADSEVTVHYRGRLLDGTEFDSSYARGQPATFSVGGVIRGWQEALVLMRPGARWQLFIPPDLAYGDNSPPTIPPGSLLLFEVELISVSSPAGTR